MNAPSVGSDAKLQASPDDTEPLARTLGPFDTTMIVMGSVIGAGIFFSPTAVAAGLRSGPLILALWVVGGLIALTGAVVFAELGGMLPRTGGQYVFLREAYGRFVAFLFGWVLLTSINSSAIAFVAKVCAEHVGLVLEALGMGALSGRGASGVALGLIVGLTGLNVLGVRLGSRIQNVAMLAKLAGMLVVVLLGAAVLVGWIEPNAPPLVRGSGAADAGPSWAAVSTALLGVVFSVGGFQNVAAVAAEIRRPQRNLPLGILVGTVGVVLLYVSLNAALLAILGAEGIAATSTPVATAAGAVLPHGAPLVAGLVVLSTFAVCQVLLMVTPRIYYAMARDGVFFAAAGKVHPRFRTPYVAILLQGGCSVLHTCFGDALSLMQLTTLADGVFFGLSALALFLLRARRPEAERPYRATGYPLLPGLFLVASFGVVASGLLSEETELEAVQRALGIFAVGVALYFVWRRRGAPQSTAGPKA